MDNKLEARIKGLTSLIHCIRPQNGPATPGNAKSSNAKAYHHIATLLTRGVEDKGFGRNVVAATGAHNANGPVVAAVSSYTDGLPSSPPMDKDLSLAHIAVTQNQRSIGDLYNYDIQKIQPNPLPLIDICKNLYVLRLLFPSRCLMEAISDVSKDVSLAQHAADVLKALTSTQGLRSASPEYRAAFKYSDEHIVRRCFPKIRRRVLGIKYLFQENWSTALDAWMPAFVETLVVEDIEHSKLLQDPAAGDTWVCVPDILEETFDMHGIPKRIHDAVLYYQLVTSTASSWLRSLVTVLSRVREAVDNYRDGEDRSFRNLSGSLALLYCYVHDLHAPLACIFNMSSLATLLLSLKQPEADMSYRIEDGMLSNVSALTS
jgi:hypothetical protein